MLAHLNFFGDKSFLSSIIQSVLVKVKTARSTLKSHLGIHKSPGNHKLEHKTQIGSIVHPKHTTNAL